MEKLLIYSALHALFAAAAFAATDATVVNTDGSTSWSNANTWDGAAVPVVDTNYNITFTPASGENEATLIVDAPTGRDANTNVTISDASVKTINLVGASTVDGKYTYFDVGSLKSEHILNFSSTEVATNYKLHLKGNISENLTINFNGVTMEDLNCSQFHGTLNINMENDTDVTKIARLSGSGSLHVNKGYLLATRASTVGSGSAINLQSNSMLSVAENATFETTSGLKFQNGRIDGKVIVNGSQSSLLDNIHFTINKKAVFGANASLEAKLADSTVARALVNNGQVYAYSAAKSLKFAQDLQLSNATLVLNSVDAISVNDGGARLLVSGYGTSYDGTTTSNLIIGKDSETGAKLAIAKNTIENINMYADSVLNLTLNGNQLEVLQISQVGESSNAFSLVLNDAIAKGDLIIGDFNGLTVADDVMKYITLGESLSDYKLFVDYVNGVDSAAGFSIYTAVPEPATYAALFGLVALAIAAYRRRK